MSALTRALRELAEEGAEIATATRRFLSERFGDAPDTPENVARIRQAAQRAEPARPRAADYAVRRAGRAAPTAQRPLAAMSREGAAPPAQRPLAVRPERPLAVQPAAEQPLALPAPVEDTSTIPSVKQRGGQWWADQEIDGNQYSPEFAARQIAGSSLPFDSSVRPLWDWWQRAVPRYLRNDFGTPSDPLRELAERNLLHTDLSPDDITRIAGSAITSDRIGNIVLPSWRGHSGADPRVGDPSDNARRQAMPWLARQPVTDPIYGMNPNALGGLDFAHVADELRNAMRPEVSGIPADLAVRPESLQRMSFPQAVERVGRINQWRAAQQAEASLAAQNNPALRTYREYAENNPRGLRWVEIAPPEGWQDAPIPDGYEEAAPELWRVLNATGAEGSPRYTSLDPRLQQLQDALRYEGDTMGHCVGGYCDDVLSGRSRIFSLRDARGEPHVTIEAAPRGRGSLSGNMLNEMEPGLFDQYLAQRYEEGGIDDMHRWLATTRPELANTTDIVQIKGKQNRAPNDEYLPFVQDFVRQGTWGNVGDLANTGLVRLPDGRYITQAQMEEGYHAAQGAVDALFNGFPAPDPRAVVRNPAMIAPEVWPQLAPYFEGYAIGGRVDPQRCFTRNPLSARR